jgi:hypothetical protein
MAKRQAFKITGNVPAFAGVPMRIKKQALPEIVKEVAVRHIQAGAPKGRGLSSPKSIASRIKGTITVPFDEGVVKAGAPHSHLLEFGVRPHSLAGKRRKKGHVMKIYGDSEFLRRDAWHPGISARPFMQQGLDAAQDDIEGVLQREALKAFVSETRSVEAILGNLS